MNFFNKISSSSKQEVKRFSLLHISIEIILVTLGILIALAIDNWNTDRVEQNEIQEYVVEMHKEFESTLKYQYIKRDVFNRQLDMLKRMIYILGNQQKDSVDVIKKNLEVITQTYGVESYTLPVTEEFINRDYINKIKNDSLKQALKKFDLIKKSAKVIWDYAQAQYDNRIEPFLTKNANYPEFAKIKGLEQLNIPNNLKTDFYKLYDSQELFNIIGFKIETISIEKKRLEKGISSFIEIKNKLKQELESLNP